MSRAVRTECWLVGVLLMWHTSLLAYSAAQHSPTSNEPGHLMAGISHWTFARFELYRVNPPLVRMVAALPVLAAGCTTDWSEFYEGPGARPEFSMGEAFIAANGHRSIWLMTLARWACIPFSVVGGLVCFLFARSLFGTGAGFVALTLWCFDPNILGHGALITPDVPAAALGILAAYLFWRWLKKPDWTNAFAAGFALGLTELTKMTWLVLFVLWPVLWLALRRSARAESRKQRAESRKEAESEEGRAESQRERGRGEESGRSAASVVQLGLILLLGLYVLNLGYGFDGTFTRLKDFTFVSEALGRKMGQAPNVLFGVSPSSTAHGNRFAESWLGQVPIPLPRQYVLGLDVQRRDFEDYAWPSYLRGEWREKGWWYYYLYGLAVKVPLGTWVLFVLAVVTAVARRGRRTGEKSDCKLSIEN